MGNKTIVTISCVAVSHAVLAQSLKDDVLHEVEHNFFAAEIIKEAINRLKKMECPAGVKGRRSYDQQQ